ncbi:hypothetical protein [Acinetobacter sp.]|uniref:hypothetical protein n=1 Tax=Acinetobacter sp. TaxID=472 RepID=UPI00388E577E
MKTLYQLWWNGKFHQYLPFAVNAHQRRVIIRRLSREGYDIFKYNVDTHEKALHRATKKKLPKLSKDLK